MKVFKKALALVLSVLMLITGAITIGATPAETPDSTALDVWDGTADTAWISENASTKTATLTTPEQFYAVSTQASANSNWAGWTINLGADLYFNAGDASTWGTTAPENTVGRFPTFSGTLNGNGHSINGLYCGSKTVEYVGLFQQLGTGAKIENISILNSYFLGYQFVGSVAGGAVRVANITINNVYSNAYVNVDCTSKQENSRVGGIIGSFHSCTDTNQVTNCTFAGTLFANATYGESSANDCATRVGGIVGTTLSPLLIENCIVTGTVIGKSQVGGILGATESGANEVTIKNSAFFGKLVSTRTTSGYLGAIIGIVYSGTSNAKITNCYYDSNYRAIYTATALQNTVNTAVWGVHSGSTLVSESTTKVTKSEFIASGAATKMAGLDYTNTWYAQGEANKNFALPRLQNANAQFSDAAIRYAGFQKSTDGTSVRFLAALDGIDAYESVSYKIEMVRQLSDGTTRTMVLNEANTKVYTSITADGTPVSAESLGGSYIYAYAVTGIPTGETLQFNVTPVLTCEGGVVITGQTVSIVYCN